MDVLNVLLSRHAQNVLICLKPPFQVAIPASPSRTVRLGNGLMELHATIAELTVQRALMERPVMYALMNEFRAIRLIETVYKTLVQLVNIETAQDTAKRAERIVLFAKI
jgi:hypothetical protein